MSAANMFETATDSSDHNLKQYILVVGGHGAGKSTISNTICGETAFNSGFSPGARLTKACQEHLWGDSILVDCPSFNTIDGISAAKEIETTLKQGGQYKLVFVITLSGGRIRADDSLMFKYMLNAVEGTNISFGILVNKATQRTKTELGESEAGWNAMLKLWRDPSELPEYHKFVVGYDEEIDGESNRLLQGNGVTNQLRDFISSIPYTEIDSSMISPIYPHQPPEESIPLQNAIDALKEAVQSLELEDSSGSP